MRELVVAALLRLVWPSAAAISLAVGVRGESVSVLGCLTLALGTAGAYALDRLRDGGDGPAVRKMLVFALFASAIGTLAILNCEPWRIAIVLFLAALAFGYVALKRFLPKNAIAATAWTVAVITLPAFVPPSFHGEFLPAAAVIALLMFANTTLCDLATIAEDRNAGVKSVSVSFGPAAAAWSALAAAMLSAGIAFYFGYWGLALTSFCQGMIAIFHTRRAATHGTRLAADAALVLFPVPLALLGV